MTEPFSIGDRVAMSIGRQWHGTIEAVSTAYPDVPVVTVRWDNGRSQVVNTYMMSLVREEENGD